MNDYTNVIYDKETNEVIVIESNGIWSLPDGCGLAEFKNGAEPVLTEDNKGHLYLNPRALLLTDY